MKLLATDGSSLCASDEEAGFWCIKKSGTAFIQHRVARGSVIGLAVDRNQVFIVEEYIHHIFVYYADGALKMRWGSGGSGPCEFLFPQALCAFDNELYVSDVGNSRIQVCRLDGAFRREWDVRTLDAWHTMWSIAVNAEEVFVSSGLEVWAYTHDGTWLRQVVFCTRTYSNLSQCSNLHLCSSDDLVHVLHPATAKRDVELQKLRAFQPDGSLFFERHRTEDNLDDLAKWIVWGHP
jgi:hypothetical protein